MEGKVSAAAEGAGGREGRRWVPRGQGLAGQWGEARFSSSATPLNKQPHSTPLAATTRAQGKHNSIDPRKHLAHNTTTAAATTLLHISLYCRAPRND